MASTSPYGLQDKQWRFVQEYLIDFDATAAYRRAKYRVTTERAAWACASRLLKNAKVQTALRAEKARLLAHAEITPEQVIKEFGRIGFSDMRHYASWGPAGVRLTDSSLLTDDAAMAVAEVSETIGEKSHTVRFKLHSKTDALQSLARYFDLFREAEGMEQLGKGLNALLAFAKGTPDAEPS